MQILTISEIRRDMNRVIRKTAERDDFVVIVRHGKPVAVLLPYDKFRALRRNINDNH